VTPRHVLFVAWWFPPLSGGGVHRPLQFVRHLARRGFRVSVLTGVPPRGERLDEGLLAQVPPEVRVVRVPLFDPFRAWAWFKARGGGASVAHGATNGSAPKPGAGAATPRIRWRDLVTEAIALPDRWLPWIVPAITRAALALRGDEPELVFSTSPPHSLHLVAHGLAGLFGAPLVLDFRDPWIGNPFRRYATPLFARADAALEQRVVGAAAQVVVNTPALERQFRARYPGFAGVRTIPNGFDPGAFAQLPAATGGGSPGFVEIAHYGQLYGLRSGKYLLHALAALKAGQPAAFARVKVLFVGSIDGEAGFRAQARELGVDGALEVAGALPHAQALARQRRSDVLLLLGPENREPEIQVPGKLYEYFAAQRPILSLSRAGGAIAEIVAMAGVPCERAEPDDPAAIAAAIARLVERADAAGAAAVDARAADATAAFRYDRLSDRLADCFADAWRARGRLAAEG
jgi:glycosyltransferase involved in cell wall biosynthesis